MPQSQVDGPNSTIRNENEFGCIENDDTERKPAGILDTNIGQGAIIN